MAFSDLAQTTLASTINSSVTTVPGVSSSKFDTGGGYLNIDNELLSYAAISGNSFTGCVRGLGSPVATTASGHNSGAIVTGVVVATQLTALTPPSFATPAIALSTVAAAGSAATVIRSDGTIAAFDATVPAGVAAAAATGSVAFAARRDHAHPGLGQPLALTGATQATRYAGATTSGAPVSGTFAVGDFVIDRTGSAWVCTAAGAPGTWTQVSGSTSFATPAILLAASAAAGAASTAIRSDATIAAFDATVPTTSNPGDAAAVGSIAFAAHRDHLHGREAVAAPVSDGSRAYNSTTVSTASSTETAVTMDSERSNSAAFHSTSTNTSRMTIPTGKAGRYTIAGTVEWAASALGTVRRLSIRLNGSTYIAKNEITSILNVVLPQEVSTVYDLAVGDYVELIAFQDTVGAVLLNASGNYSPEFAISAGGAGGFGTTRRLVDPTGLSWSWLNQGVASIATQGAALLLSSPAESADNWHFRGKAVPSKPYSVVIHMLPTIMALNYSGFAVGWLRTSDNHFAVVDQHGASLVVESSYSVTPWVLTSVYVTPLSSFSVWSWVKLTDDVTNRQIYVSADGFNWVLFHSVATNDQITPDRLVFGLESRNATYGAALFLDSWEEF